MKYIFLLDIILIIYICHSNALHVVSQRKPCSQVLPFHATEVNSQNNNCSWTCNSGYFSTSPATTSGIPTCRSCAQSQNCKIGYFQTACSDTSDSLCLPCPTLSQMSNREGEVYIEPNTCSVTGCSDGWMLNQVGNQSITDLPPKCKPCPIGPYCIQGIPHLCGINCSTETESSFSPLQCKQTSGSEIAFYIRSTISGSGLTLTKETQCYDLNNDIINWLQYGTLQECIINVLSPSMGILTCTILAARCIASNYLQWLLENIASHKIQTANLLSTCLNAPGITLGQPQIQQTVLSLAVAPNTPSSYLVTPPTDSPIFIMEPSKWGHNRGEILSATSFMFLICLGLLLVLVLVCGLWAVRSATQSSVGDLFRLLNNRHESKLSVNNFLPQTHHKRKDIP